MAPPNHALTGMGNTNFQSVLWDFYKTVTIQSTAGLAVWIFTKKNVALRGISKVI